MVGLLLIGGLEGCQTAAPETASVISQPTTPIVKNITSFSDAQRCMDRLFAEYGKRDIVITSDGLPDHTAQIAAGTKDMMITALSRMSAQSRAFRFVDIEHGGAVDFIQNAYGENFAVPNYYIRGAITQVDRNVATDSKSAGFALPMLSLGYSEDQLLSVVTIDMNIGDLVKREIVPGMHTTNTITVVSAGSGADAEGIIGKASLFFEVSQDRNQGTHQSVRTLVDLGLIEVLGKLTKVPYWRCLELDSTEPTVIEQARSWYDSIPAEDRPGLIQTALGRAGYYKGPTDGRMSAALQDAINRYKARNDLIANGRIDFDLYYSLLVDKSVVVPSGEDLGSRTETASGSQPSAVKPIDGDDGIRLAVRQDGPAGKAYRVGDTLAFNVSVQRDAYVYCYYEFVDGDEYKVARIFPNRGQPTALIGGGRSVTIPSERAGFEIELAASGIDEQVACVAVEEPYARNAEPEVLREPDLTPLRSARRLYAVVDQHLQAERFGTDVKHIRWKVR